MTSYHFDHVFIESRGCVAGVKEKQGPLASLFDKTYDDYYAGEKSFEKCEQLMMKEASEFALKKANYTTKDIDLAIGGDLMNQLSSSHYFARSLPIPFIGMYAACATSALIIAQAAIYIEKYLANRVLVFTSSNANSAERQFRYPNEYGVQKKASTTITVSGAGACILSSKQSQIKVTCFTVGKIIDWDFDEVGDLGSAMAPAAFDTLLTHFKDTKRTIDDYDLIVTGDLSSVGFAFFCDLIEQEKWSTNKLNDCGLMIYHDHQKDTFSGGSGCACSMLVTMSDLLNKIEDGSYHRIMLIATGALLSPVLLQQKESIPCIAHAIVFEGEANDHD
ncbi:MAG: stage V sporulation protein AD [Erysipelotrichaceae bacterium]